MSRARSHPPPRRRAALAVPLAALLVLLVLSPAGATVRPIDDRAPLAVEVHARAIAPGEPLRVTVTSEEPLASVGGEFLGRTLFFSRTAGRGRTWSAWTLVPLDQEPGPAGMTLRAVAPPDRELSVLHEVTVEHRDFPEERLQVADRYVEPPREVRERLADERARLATIYRSRRAAGPAGEPFVRPVPGKPTSIFGMRRFFNDQPRSPHPGLDLRAATGTPVHASGDGLVVLAENLYYSGNTVIVDHGGGLFTLYAHLSKLFVEPGQAIEAGARLGLSGATGRVTGPHLHWGAKIGDEPFDPTALLAPEVFR